jgi:tetratricopeptide (TPR) repeat protein
MSERDTSAPRRLGARCWYLWGLSVCYSANVAGSRALYGAGAWSFARAAALWPAFAQAHYQLGVIRGRELGQFPAAVAALDRASALRPDWPEPYLQRGLLRRFNGEPRAALADLRRYGELAPPGHWRDEAERQIVALEAELGSAPPPVL